MAPILRKLLRNSRRHTSETTESNQLHSKKLQNYVPTAVCENGSMYKLVCYDCREVFHGEIDFCLITDLAIPSVRM